MGFRCPKCKIDFGNDRKALDNHFQEYEYCRYEAIEVFGDRKNVNLAEDGTK